MIGKKIKEKKINSKYKFPFVLNMDPYTEHNDTKKSKEEIEIEKEDKVYELFAVLIHSGGAYGGHYHGYIEDIMKMHHFNGEKNIMEKIKIMQQKSKEDDDENKTKDDKNNKTLKSSDDKENKTTEDKNNQINSSIEIKEKQAKDEEEDKKDIKEGKQEKKRSRKIIQHTLLIIFGLILMILM